MSFALLFIMGACWAIASPLLSGADEGAHAIKAASVVRGELKGANTGPHGRPWLVHVPGTFARAQDPFALCYLGANKAGSCGVALGGSTATEQVNTQFGGYPPLYYVAVGLPSLASSSAAGVYLMRLVSVTITSAFLASALVSAFSWRRSRMLVLGAGVAMVPTVIYIGAVLNDSGLEIAAAICLWTSLLVLVLDPPSAGPGGRLDSTAGAARLLTRAGISACALVLARPLSPLWLVVIATTVLAAASRERILATLRRRDVQTWIVIVGACTVLALVWTTTVGVSVIVVPCPKGLCTSGFVAGYVLSHTDTYVNQMTGLFSYTNVSAPLFSVVIWWSLVGLLALVALVVGRRHAIVLVCLAAATIFLPVVILLLEASNYGILWQGRYSLPLATGIPLLSAFIIGKRLPGLEHRHWRLATTAVAAIAVAHIGAFIWVLRHFMWGQGQWSFLHSQWEPPIPGILLVIAFAGVTAAYALWLRAHLTGTSAPVRTNEDVRRNRLGTGIDTLRT